MTLSPPHKIAACTLFLHFMIKSFENFQFCVLPNNPPFNFFFCFGNFQKYDIVPIFLFKTFHFRIQATQVPPPYFFTCGQVHGLSVVKKKYADRYGSNYVRKVSSNHCFQCFAPKKVFYHPEKKMIVLFFPPPRYHVFQANPNQNTLFLPC